jgi:predicted Zn-dependent protease with MMP-like domain
MAPLLSPTASEIEALADEALATIPEALRQYTNDLIIQVTEFPDDDVLAEMEAESPFEIMGLYQGTSMLEDAVEHSGALPNMVFLYRRPILDYWAETGEDLRHLVRHVLIHEIGHHFGFSDEDMEALEAEADAEEAR